MAPSHVSSRYHQSLRNQLICKGTVILTYGAKLMVLFLSILGWSLLESLGTIFRAGLMYNLHKRSGPVRCVSAASPMPKPISFLRKGKRSTMDGLAIAYLSLVELLDIYHG